MARCRFGTAEPCWYVAYLPRALRGSRSEALLMTPWFPICSRATAFRSRGLAAGAWLVSSLALGALASCDDRRAASVGATWEDVCIDVDGDRFGFQCSDGADCDDSDPAVHEGCHKCQKHEEGCACDAESKPLDCALPLSVDARGSLICRTGTRYCRDGSWSACEGVATFAVAAGEVRDVSTRALVDPDAPPEPCDPCHPGCFRVEDTMTVPANYTLPSGLAVAASGGVTLAGEFPPGYEAPYTGPLDDAPCAADDMPDCDGLPSPFDSDQTRAAAGSSHRTLFMDLPPGASLSRRVAARVFLSSADVYFYLDATSTMRDEMLRLVADFRTGNFLPDAGANFDCVDADYDGVADNQKKSEGIAGNIACLVRDARFGAGWFREIPFYGPFLATQQAVAPWDTEMFEHRHDISADFNSVAAVLSGFNTRANLNAPEGGMQGLWAIATGSEIYAGWDRPGVPARSGCPAGSFGYPCFREDALPIVLHFTDAPMQEGPGTRERPAPETNPATPADCLSDAEYADGEIVCDPLHYDAAVLSGLMSGSEGHYRELVTSAEDRAHAEPVGSIDEGLVTYVGSSEHMTADHTYANLGGFSCPHFNAWSPVDQSAPDAAFSFRVGTRARYLISGRGTRFDATFMLLALDGAGTPIQAITCSDTAVHLDQPGELDNAPEIEMDLDPGNYLLVLKGYRGVSRGMFQVSFGRRGLEQAGSFQPKRWLGPAGDGAQGIRQALVDRAIRVVTIQSGSDPYTREQSLALAAASGASAGGQPLVGAVGSDVSLLGSEVVRVVRELALGTQMDVSIALLGQPHAATPPFGLRVEAVQTLGSGCAGVADTDGDGTPDTHLGCSALAHPEFDVTFSNGTGDDAVPPNGADPQGGYQMALQVLGDRRYLLDQVPVYLVPRDVIPDPVPPLYSASASYEQTVVANGCEEREGPLWLSLVFDATVPEGSELVFDMCGGESEAALGSCTFSPIATVTRGGPCDEQNDCGTEGYCDPSGFCQRVRGLPCEDDAQCGTFGTCSPTDRICTYARNAVDLRQSAAQAAGRSRTRVRARLSANADRTQAPTLLRWTIDYVCTPLE
jgi:hypothetical protein